MTPGASARPFAAVPLDLTKRDLSLDLGGRTFSVRAYLDRADPDGPGWHTIIVENRTPLRHPLGPAADPEVCLAAAVRFLTAVVAADATGRDHDEAQESEGGVLSGRKALDVAGPPHSRTRIT